MGLLTISLALEASDGVGESKGFQSEVFHRTCDETNGFVKPRLNHYNGEMRLPEPSGKRGAVPDLERFLILRCIDEDWLVIERCN